MDFGRSGTVFFLSALCFHSASQGNSSANRSLHSEVRKDLEFRFTGQGS